MRRGIKSVFWLVAVLVSTVRIVPAAAAPAEPVVKEVDAQPLKAQAARVVQALELAGAPLDEARRRSIEGAGADNLAVVVQESLDPLCLAVVNINPESRVKVAEGPVDKTLTQQGWRVFLVKVVNEAGVTAPLRCTSPNAAPLYKRSTGSPDPQLAVK